MSQVNQSIRQNLHKQYEDLQEQIAQMSLDDLVEEQIKLSANAEWDLGDDDLLSADLAQVIATEELHSLAQQAACRATFEQAKQVNVHESLDELRETLRDDVGESLMGLIPTLQDKEGEDALSALLFGVDFEYLANMYGWAGPGFQCSQVPFSWERPDTAKELFAEVGRIDFSRGMRSVLELNAIDDFIIIERDFRGEIAQMHLLHNFLALHDTLGEMQEAGYFDYLTLAKPCYVYAATAERDTYCIYQL